MSLLLVELSNTTSLVSFQVGSTVVVVALIGVIRICATLDVLVSLMDALLIALTAGSVQSEEVSLPSLPGTAAGSAQSEEVSLVSLGSVSSGMLAAGFARVSLSSLLCVLSKAVFFDSSHVGSCGACY